TGDVRREWRASGGAVQVAGMAGAGTLSIRPGSSTLLIAWRENSAGTDAQLKEIVVDGTDVAVVGAATPGQPGTYYASVDSSALQSPSGATTQSIEVGGGFIVDWGVVAIFPGNGTVVVPGIFGETTPAGPRAGDSVKVRALVLGDSVSSLQLGGSKALVSGFVGSLGMRVSDASMPPIVVNSTDGESPLGLLVYQY
ncbi:MAG TPA: hypothetical protein PKV27_04755, partial [Ilumatobacteraceae bacterium]|nr:hypothetical protein [Ilumatobacteraceae bacterium]